MAQPLFPDDPLTQLAFALAGAKGTFALLLGSGLSRAAEIPTGWEITLDLIRRIASAQGVTKQADWAKWYRETTGNEPSYSKLLATLARTAVERRVILESYIEPDSEDVAAGRKQPTKAHRAIADMVADGVIRVIVTTNFDRLIENAIRDRGVEPVVVSSVDALSGAEPISHARCYVLKLHGDYKDARILNTDEELSSYPRKYEKLLDRIFDEYGLIVSGWSGDWDTALRSVMSRSVNRRYPIYWSARGKLSERASSLVTLRDATVITTPDADTFFGHLARQVQTIRESRRQNPQSVDLLVSGTKRLLTKPEFRIQLDELIANETSNALGKLGEDTFSPDRGWSAEDFRSRISQYESAVEGLAKAAGIIGRWGDDGHLNVVLDIVQTLYADARRLRSGLTYYSDIRSYPAVLVFTAYAIGLVRSSSWSRLNRLFNSMIAREDREPIAIVPGLFLFGWDGGSNDIWRHLEGFDRRKTALSDHVLDVLKDWSTAFVGLVPDFELLFERYEILGTLAHFSQNESDTLEPIRAGSSRGVWMSIGRSIWNARTWEQLKRELKDAEFRSAIASGGLGRGNPAYIDLFITNFELLRNERW